MEPFFISNLKIIYFLVYIISCFMVLMVSNQWASTSTYAAIDTGLLLLITSRYFRKYLQHVYLSSIWVSFISARSRTPRKFSDIWSHKVQRMVTYCSLSWLVRAVILEWQICFKLNRRYHNYLEQLSKKGWWFYSQSSLITQCPLMIHWYSVVAPSSLCNSSNNNFPKGTNKVV